MPYNDKEEWVHDPNEGSVFKVKERKTEGSFHWTGSGCIDLEECGIGSGKGDVFIGIWENETKSGKPKLKIKFGKYKTDIPF